MNNLLIENLLKH